MKVKESERDKARARPPSPCVRRPPSPPASPLCAPQEAELAAAAAAAAAEAEMAEIAAMAAEVPPPDRAQMPECLVTRIRDRFPSPTNIYKGFLI